jgi:hypothetical protein
MTDWDRHYIKGTLRKEHTNDTYIDDLGRFGGWVLAIAAFVALGVWAVLL